MATHLGPWLLGTVKNTTGSTAGLVRNMGATVVSQDKATAYNDAASTLAFALPAGALITGLQYVTTATFSAATTLTVSINGTAINSATTVTSINSYTPTYVASAAVQSLLRNVGTTDALVTYTLTGTSLTTGAGTLIINYVVRNADGTYTPTSALA
jgi:hypothetical protein